MFRRFPLALLLLAGGVAAAADRVPARPADVFGLTKVWAIHLEISAKDWDAMQPAGGPRLGFPGPGGPGQPPRPGGPDAPRGDSRVSAFGVEFPYARGTFTADGETLKDVGIRFKGNSSYMAASRGLKRPFKIDFNRNNETQTFHGLKALNLNNNAMDPTQLREALSYAVFNAADVPAPRTAFAEVTLTVPGKYDKEYLGLYTVIEEVDKTFLKDRFKSSKGLLLKPERVGPVQYLGEDWSAYQDRYNPKTEVKKKDTRRFIDFVRLVNRGSDEEFRQKIGDYLDVDEFLRFLAANALLCNLDSFLTLGHNYYMYLHQDTNKIVFIPWDLNHSLGGFVMLGSPDQLADLSVSHPHSGQNPLIDRLLAIPEVRKNYEDHVRRLLQTCFAAETMNKDIDVAEQAVKEIMAKEAKAAAARKEGQGFGMPPMFAQLPSLKTFVRKRSESVVAQLAGKSQGYVPTMRFGPPGGPGRPGGFGPGNFLARPVLEAADGDKNGKLSKDELIAAAKRFFNECDKEKKEAIDQKALAEGIDRIFPRPPGFPGGPQPGGPQPGGPQPGDPPPGGPQPGGPQPGGPPRPGPGGFPPGRPGVVMFPGPGPMLAGNILKRADADKDGKLTATELTAAAEVLFKETDKDKSGALEEKEVAEAINQLFPPPGFGPPGPPPGREPPRQRPPQEGRP